MELSDPRRYQQSLLDAVGADDPAEVLTAAPGEWAALVEAAASDVRTRPEPAEWSVIELLGHATDAQLVTAARIRWVLAEDSPPLHGYDQDRWVAAERHVDADPAVLLGLYRGLVAADVALWRATDPAARSRFGLHAERGPESLDLLFRMIAGHHRVHLRQASRALDLVRGSAAR